MASYNPQLFVEINEIFPDGSDLPFEVDFFGGADQNHHSENKPPVINCNITNSLGATQNTLFLTITNSPYIEEFRRDPQAQLERIKGKKLRIRVWAWYDDNSSLTRTAQPLYQPVFVGDALEGFSVSADGINDASIIIQAQGHAWLSTSGKLKRTWEPGFSYKTIAEEIMLYFIEERGQGQETNSTFPHFVVDDLDLKLEEKLLESPLTINRNPMEVLNDICRDLDFVWGIHNNIPYIVSRNRPSQFDKLLISPFNQISDQKAECNSETGMTSIISYGTIGFSYSHNYDRNIFPGRVVEASDEPQTGERGTFVAGRVNSVNTTINNYTGHSMRIECDYLTEYNPLTPLDSIAVLPERRADNSGLRSV